MLRGNKPRATIKLLMDTATSSVGVTSPAKELALKQEAELLIHVEQQIDETTKLLVGLLDEKMKHDVAILCSMKGIGEKTAVNFLIEIGGEVAKYDNDKKLIAASGLQGATGVPEPASMLFIGLGVFVLAGVKKRINK